VQSEAAPTGADLDHAIAGTQPELAGDEVQTRQLRFVQGHLRRGECRCRVHQRFVEEQLEEVVAQVVVRSDVLPRSAAGVTAKRVQELLQRRREACRPAIQSIEHVHVQDEQPHQIDELRGAPVSVHVRFARADRTAQGEVAVEPRIVHLDQNFVGKRSAERAARVSLGAFDENDTPAAYLHESCPHRAPRDRVDRIAAASIVLRREADLSGALLNGYRCCWAHD